MITTLFLLLSGCDSENGNMNNIEAFNNWYYVRMNDGIIYHDRELNIKLLDCATMDSALLCNVPNCSHTNSECIMEVLKKNSQLPVIYNGSAYFFENQSQENFFVEKDGKYALNLKFKLKKYNFANCEYSDCVEVNDCVVNESGGCYLVGSEYYFTTYYGNPTYDKAGNVTSSSSGGNGNLFSINLDTGKVRDYGAIFDYEKLTNEYPPAKNSTFIYLMGKIENKLYISVGYNKEKWTEEMKKRNEVPELFGMNYTFDLTTKKLEKIDDKLSMCTMNGYHTYFESEQDRMISIQNVETGEVFKGPKINSLNAITVFGDKMWHDHAMCYDIKTGEEIQLSEYSTGQVVAEYNDSYIFLGKDYDGNTILEKLPKSDFE